MNLQSCLNSRVQTRNIALFICARCGVIAGKAINNRFGSLLSGMGSR